MPPVLLIIDVQEGFINDWTRHMPAAVEALQARFPRVVATRFENREGSPFRTLKALARFAPGSAEGRLAFVPRPDAEIAVKTGYTAVSDKFLASLREGQVREVAVSGIATDNCVLVTAVDLFQAGLRPLVLADYCASHAGEAYHRAGLMLLERLVGEGQIVRGPI
ncbi:MAG: cysteine hydrolase [Alphaproteobacteria bacterium]